MLTPEQIQERDPAVLQSEILRITEQISDVTTEVNAALDAKLSAHTEFLKADATLRHHKFILKELQEKKNGMQAVLKSLPRE